MAAKKNSIVNYSSDMALEIGIASLFRACLDMKSVASVKTIATSRFKIRHLKNIALEVEELLDDNLLPTAILAFSAKRYRCSFSIP